MKREEAEALSKRLAAEHPDRSTHYWFAQEVGSSGQWRVVKVPGTGRGATIETIGADPNPLLPPGGGVGPLSDIPPERMARICTELASEVGLDAGAARTALRKAVLFAADRRPR